MFSELIPLAETGFPPLLCANAAGRLLHSDSRKIGKGDIFIACQGEYSDGRQYIADAVQRGASFVYWDDDDTFTWRPEWNVPNQGIANLRMRAGILAAEVYGNISGSLKCWGVTGTNGKTSISQWLAQAVDLLGGKCAIVGTVGNGFWGNLQTATHTTPDPVAVQTLIRGFIDSGADTVAMEVSSHGLDQFRVNGVPFRTAVFTNLTRDHLDYHGSMEAYGETKARLFYWQGLQHAVINIDDEFGAKLYAQLRTERPDLAVYGYGFAENAEIRISAFESSVSGMRLHVETPWGGSDVHCGMLGRFNAYNLAACIGVLCAEGYPLADVVPVLAKIRPASGRMDCIIREHRPLVVVDYAHTPDALEKALSTLNEVKSAGARLWCVFGCGGDRDRGKRPLMGVVAQSLSDCPIVTSDNPRTENPQVIIDDILAAVPSPTLVEADRKRAIEYAVRHAAAGDIVLIAGKGHENYQDINGQKHHFSDFEIAEAALSAIGG